MESKIVQMAQMKVDALFSAKKAALTFSNVKMDTVFLNYGGVTAKPIALIDQMKT